MTRTGSALRVLVVGDARAALLESLYRRVVAAKQLPVVLDVLDTSNGYLDASQVPQWVNGEYAIKGTTAAQRVRRRLRLARRALSRTRPYDVVHVHYLDATLASWWPVLRALAHRLVVTVWGSDLLRAPPAAMGRLRMMLRVADEITTTSPSMFSELRRVAGHRILARTRVLRFGLDVVEILRHDLRDRTKSKQSVGLDPSRRCVLLGHSSSPGHQHEQVLQELARAGILYESSTQFVVHLAYGDPLYRTHLTERIRSSEWPVVIDTKFRTREALADFRSAFDVFVNVLVTDQFSGSMCEHLMAGSSVVAGSWLDYGILDAYGATLTRVDSIAEVPAKVSSLLGDQRAINEDISANREAAFQLTSWTSNFGRWIDYYAELAEKVR